MPCLILIPDLNALYRQLIYAVSARQLDTHIHIYPSPRQIICYLAKHQPSWRRSRNWVGDMHWNAPEFGLNELHVVYLVLPSSKDSGTEILIILTTGCFFMYCKRTKPNFLSNSPDLFNLFKTNYDSHSKIG